AGSSREMTDEKHCVIGDMTVQLDALCLNRRSVLAKERRDLRNRLATPAAQERLGLMVRSCVFFAHQALGAFDITGRTSEQWPRDLPALSLVELRRGGLLVSLGGGLRPLPGRPVIVENMLCGVAGRHSHFLDELEILSCRLRIVGQLRF